MPNQPVDLYIDCVVLTSFDSEFSFLCNVFRPSGIRMHHAESLEKADFLLTVTESTVLLTDVTFADGRWESALALLCDSYPLVTMLVIADRVDCPYLRDLFPRGACGVLWKPFDLGVATLERRSRRGIGVAGPVRCGIPSSDQNPLTDRWPGVGRVLQPFARSTACRIVPCDL